MTQLTDTLETLGLEGEVSLSGRWAKIQGERCVVYVVEASWQRGYYTWCEDDKERAVEFYHDPQEAVLAGLRRASGKGDEG